MPSGIDRLKVAPEGALNFQLNFEVNLEFKPALKV